MNSIPLSPVDYVFTGAGSQPITFAFYFSQTQDANKLKQSLRETLRHFTVLQSRLKRVSENSFVFEEREDGLEFDVKNIDSWFDKGDNILKYISPVRTRKGNALSKISLSNTPSGSVLAVSISHALVDGFSYFHFLSSWARISRGERFIPPHIDRSIFGDFLDEQSGEITAELLFDKAGLFYGDSRTDEESPVNEKFFIESGTIKEISERARNKNILLTENDVITGIIWKKCLADWAGEDKTGRVYLTFPFDFRRALPGFPKNYFGCAICFGTAAMKFSELMVKSDEEIAHIIKNSVAKIKSDYILNSIRTLDNFRDQKGTNEFEKLHLRHPGNGMIITNISRLPVKELDFGNGTPSDVITFAEVPGSSAILPAEGGVEVLVSAPMLPK